MGLIGTGALPVLAEALSDPLIEVRMNVVRAIDRIGGEGAIAPPVRALRDDALAVKKRAEWGLIQIEEAAIPELDLALSREMQPGPGKGCNRSSRISA